MSSLADSFSGLAKGAAVIFAATVMGRLLSLLGEVLIIRSLSPGTFGTIALVYTGVLTLTNVGLLGVPSAVSRMLSDESVRPRETDYMSSGYLIVFASASVIALGLMAFSQELGALMDNPRVAELVPIFVPFVFLFPVGRVSIAILRAKKRSVQAALSQDLGPRLAAIGIFVLFASLGRPFDGAIVYWIVTPAFATLIAVGFLSRESSILSVATTTPSRDVVGDLWSFSWPLAVRASLVTLMTSLDVLMIGLFLESTMVGFYRSVQPLKQITHFVLQSFVFLFLPLATEFYARDEIDELGDFYRVSSKWIAVLTLPPVLVFSLFSGDLIRTILSPEYLPGSLALSVLTAGLYFNALVGPNGAMLKAVGRPRVEMYAATLGVTVNLALNVLLIPIFGIVGAAFATVLGYLAFNVVEVVAIYRIVGTHPFSANSLQPIAVTALVGVFVAWVVGGSDLGLPALIGIGLLLAAVQAVAVPATRSLDETDRVLLRKAKGRLGLG